MKIRSGFVSNSSSSSFVIQVKDFNNIFMRIWLNTYAKGSKTCIEDTIECMQDDIKWYEEHQSESSLLKIEAQRSQINILKRENVYMSNINYGDDIGIEFIRALEQEGLIKILEEFDD